MALARQGAMDVQKDASDVQEGGSARSLNLVRRGSDERSLPRRPGLWFEVAGNSEPRGDGTPDMKTLIGAGGAGTAQDYCHRAPEPTFPVFLEHGNIQVRDGS